MATKQRRAKSDIILWGLSSRTWFEIEKTLINNSILAILYLSTWHLVENNS